MIKIQSVSKQYPSKKAVNDISFDAKQGDIIGFLGPNGAGKTTTMRLLLGYLTPTKGKVQVNGKDPLQDRISILKHVGYLPENNPLYYDMKVQEYLQFIKEVKKTDDDLDEIAQNVGLEERMDARIEHLSRGYKQRVGLASALISDPQILILDEPTSGLDPIEQEKIRTLIKQKAKKKTTIFSTHILSEVEEIATRLIIIHNGSLVYDGEKPSGKGAVEKLFKKLVK
jgi:ABC-2 type transport system ATP-binding protein